MILHFRWLVRMLRDIVLCGIVNRSYALSLTLIALFVIGLTMVVAQVASPFIYALF